MSALNAFMKSPVIPFIRKKSEKEIRKVTLHHTVTINVVLPNGQMSSHRDKRSASLIVAEDDDIEILIRLGISYLESTGVESLSFSDGKLFTEFRTHF